MDKVFVSRRCRDYCGCEILNFFPPCQKPAVLTCTDGIKTNMPHVDICVQYSGAVFLWTVLTASYAHECP